MKLKNIRRSPIANSKLVVLEDGTRRNAGGLVATGEIDEFNQDSRAVQLYARGGYLEPVDKEGRLWLAQISGVEVV